MVFEKNFSKLSTAEFGVGSNDLGNSYSNQMNYNAEELRNMAAYLRRNADNGLQRTISGILSNLSSVWSGPASQEFYTKIMGITGTIESKVINSYNDMASSLERAAYDLEQTTNKLIPGINNF